MTAASAPATESVAERFLSRVNAALRASRPPLSRGEPWYVVHEEVGNELFTRVWFLSGGCAWDRRGRCTMCNYGHGAHVEGEEIATWAAQAFSTLTEPVGTLFFGPSGSMLDAREVPAAIRRRIYAMARHVPASAFAVEARPESVTAETVEELRAAFAGRAVSVGLGLESASPWVQRFSIDKGVTLDAYCAAITLLRAADIRVHLNAVVGAPFLSAAEAVSDALHTVEWALANGADEVVLFPLHVRPHTVLAVLRQAGHYQPPSLWSLIAVLEQLPAELLPKVQISWHRDYTGDPQRVADFPTTCPACADEVLALLDQYRQEPSARALAELTRRTCPCRTRWWQGFRESPGASLRERALRGYAVLASTAGLQDWWEDHRSAIARELTAAAGWEPVASLSFPA